MTWDDEDFRDETWDASERDPEGPSSVDIAPDEAGECPQCGNQLYTDLEHCPACDHWLEEPETAPTPRQWGIAVLLIGGITLAMGLWYLL